MKKLFLLLFFTAMISSQVFAVLPPLWENVREIKTILSDPRLGDWMESGEVLQQIQKNESGWVLTSNKSRLQAIIIRDAQMQPGPSAFHIEFKKLP